MWNYYKYFLQKNLKLKSYKNKGGLYKSRNPLFFITKVYKLSFSKFN
ncbi:hypothetical protein PCS8106_02448 [Streptococcus pneumoniae PCS8106]|nr:hypothetical protein PCS8106_02448 [Streptococcus pneumoniae PCS8106]